MSFEEKLWELSLLLPSMEKMETEELLQYYSVSYMLQNKAPQGNCKKIADHIVSEIEKEISRRDCNILTLFVQMDENGNFLHGREDLKKFWSTLEFESMVEIADNMLEYCDNERQREAIIDLQREVLYM